MSVKFCRPSNKTNLMPFQKNNSTTMHSKQWSTTKKNKIYVHALPLAEICKIKQQLQLTGSRHNKLFQLLYQTPTGHTSPKHQIWILKRILHAKLSQATIKLDWIVCQNYFWKHKTEKTSELKKDIEGWHGKTVFYFKSHKKLLDSKIIVKSDEVECTWNWKINQI